MPPNLKQSLKTFVPERLLNARRRFVNRRADRPFLDKSPEEVFTTIYRTSEWGGSATDEQPFYSGPGSHDEGVVDGYWATVTRFLSSLDHRPDAVDLGCGSGELTKHIHEHLSASETVGVDRSATMLNDASKHAGEGLR